LGSDFQTADYATWSDPLNGYPLFGNKSKAIQSGIYAQEEFHVSKFILRAGMRYNYIKNTIELAESGALDEDTEKWNSLIWSTGIKYKINSDISIAANAGNSFITPGLKALGGTISAADRGVIGRNGQLPNPDLIPESGLGADLGADANLPLNFKVSVRGFYTSITDAIIDNSVSEEPSQTQSINAGETTSMGVEAEVKQVLSNNIQWFANYTYMNTKVKDAGTVPFAPEQIANAGINITTSFGFSISPYLNYNNGFYDSSNETSRNFFKPGALLNINAIQVLSETETYKIEAFGNFYNVTNNKYVMPWQFQNPGFSFMAGIRATF
jgi:outer membrane receptor protein involved in Fe transport